MKKDLQIQFQKYALVFAGILVLILCGNVTSSILRDGDNENIVVISSIVPMFCWCFITIYCGYEIFKYLYDCDDYLLLSHPKGKMLGVILKNIVFVTLYFVMSILNYIVIAITVSVKYNEGFSLIGFSYFSISKFVSILCFTFLIAVLSLAAKLIKIRFLAFCAVIIVYFAITYTTAITVIGKILEENTNLTWAIGINSEFSGINQFVNILPIMVWEKGSSAILYFPIVIIVNLCILLACLLVYLPLKKKRMNFISNRT